MLFYIACYRFMQFYTFYDFRVLGCFLHLLVLQFDLLRLSHLFFRINQAIRII